MFLETSILVTSILAVMLLAFPKKYFLLPFILAACFIPTDQKVMIFDLNFPPLRILVVVGFLRIILRAEQFTFKWNYFDKLVMAWAICGAIIYVIQWMDMRAIISKCGILFNIIGSYWLFRLHICSWKDIKLIIKILAVCSIVLAVFVVFEWITGQNPFVIMGRVRTTVRGGDYRCQASFPHAIMLGLFSATVFPLFIGLARTENQRFFYWIASGASCFIVIATASSTPYLTFLIVIIILCVYKWRHYTRFATWILVVSIGVLHVIMVGPVWSLFTKMNIVPGSTGLHRFRIIDQAIIHFNEWAFLGCQTTEHWGRGLSDITNQYVFEAVQGGLITLVIFFILLYTALRSLLLLSLTCKEHKKRFLAWCVFTVVAGNCISFLGVSYFGQIVILLYLNFAIVGSLIEQNLHGKYILNTLAIEN